VIEILENILACPECKGKIKLEVSLSDDLMINEGEINCTNCKGKYLIKDGIFFLRKSPNSSEAGSGEKWELEKFEKRYDALGIYKNAWEWGRLTGIPDQVTSFMYPKVKGRILEWISPDNNDIVLDIGCGVGYFIFEIMGKNPLSETLYIGVDVASSNIRWLNKRCREEKVKNVIGIVGNSLSLPIISNSINYVVCSEVLEHVYQPDLAIKEISRVLKRDGQFLLSTPLKEGIELWKFIIRPFKMVITKVTKKNKKENIRGYDSPISSAYIKESISRWHLEILNFEYNVILPPEEYFKKIPDFLVRVIIWICGTVEKYFKFLFKPFATHAVVRSRKKIL